jgi:hypothetical protein
MRIHTSPLAAASEASGKSHPSMRNTRFCGVAAFAGADGVESTNRQGGEASVAKGSPRFAKAGDASTPPHPTKNDLRPGMELLP